VNECKPLIVGRFMAFDRHMNLVLGDAEEFRKLPPKKAGVHALIQIRVHLLKDPPSSLAGKEGQ